MTYLDMVREEAGSEHLSLPSTNVDGGSTEKAAEGRRTASCCKDMTAQLASRSNRTLHDTIRSICVACVARGLDKELS